MQQLAAQPEHSVSRRNECGFAQEKNQQQHIRPVSVGRPTTSSFSQDPEHKVAPRHSTSNVIDMFIANSTLLVSEGTRESEAENYTKATT